MKKRDVEIGGMYQAKVSGELTRIRIDSESRYGGWNGTNLRTGRQIRIKTAARLRCRIDREQQMRHVYGVGYVPT